MSATEAEIKIDLDAVDPKKAEKDTKVVKSETKVADSETIEVKKTDPETKRETREVITPDEGLEKLKKQLETERAARLESDRRAQEASESEVRARTDVQATQLDLVTNAIASVTQANVLLKSKYIEARAANDLDAEFEIQTELSKNAAKLDNLERGKAALEKAPKPQPRAPQDQVEQFAARLTPQSAAWVRAHPEYVRDPMKNRAMLAAHELAMSRGIQADTDAYFRAIEKTLELAGDPSANGAGTHIEIDPTGADDPTAQAAQPVRRAPPAAAPVTRSGNGAGNRSNVVTLSAAEREMAKLNGMTDHEYAVQKVALQREGKLNLN